MKSTSHFALLVVFSLLVSIVFAVVHKDDLKGRIRFGVKVFGAFLLTAIVVGWLMYWFPS